MQRKSSANYATATISISVYLIEIKIKLLTIAAVLELIYYLNREANVAIMKTVDMSRDGSD